MALPPFNELRLKPGEEPDQQRLEELFDGYMRNFEDLYEKFPLQSTELASGAVRVIGGKNHLENWGEATVTFAASAEASLEFEHKLGATPTNVQVTAHDSSFNGSCVSRNPTKIKIILRILSGTFTGSIGFDWDAKV